jgi:hypothetical protein
MNNEQLKQKLNDLDACSPAMEWLGERDAAQMWAECERGDWMLWLAKRLGVNKRQLTLAKGKVAETVKHLMKDERSRNAVEVAIRYGYSEATEDELYAADADAAYAAAAAADAYADAYAAYAAAYADADAAYAAAAAAADADDAAYAAYAAAYADADAAYADAYADAAYADADAAYAAARMASLKQSAQIVRDVIPFETILTLLCK